MQKNVNQSRDDESRSSSGASEITPLSRIQHIVDRATETYLGIIQQRAKIIITSFIAGGTFGIVAFIAGYVSHG